ncbi:osmoprotectant ABC transporter substrate-binding protein [Halobacillus shinanisalinarum]|uniref:Osmoprotectant ABC transporter substrate-binding protein n=1 Tax=Halobacillus shinanisalinarum TaxID=2932258 RepID=A0ABY4H4E4_9BACI|nr:osmoprotectant ABC transporter substrate-binding protein [Halobacillus shinanisalinarum]UOQ95335.1 osmoprotectant ABC transporter substrate-binding protein [Halobacillus shinanisalinarum]
MVKTNKKSIVALLLTLTLLGGCSLPGLSGPSEKTVTIGTLGTAESSIMGNMVRLMINHYTDLETEMISNMGSSTVQHEAMMSGDVDITATRYTGTDLVGALGREPITDPDKALKVVKKEFQQQFNQTWFDSYGFANSYAFTVTSELAEKENLKTVSDLESIASELRLGVDSSWIERPGVGYESFVKKYGYEFGRIFPMSIGLVYKAVESGEMDVVLAYTTDGRLESFDLVTLEDDKHLFPPYDSSPVARNEVLNKHPELRDILKKLSGTISTQKMREMNYMANVKMKEPALVAKDFLEKHNYFEQN